MWPFRPKDSQGTRPGAPSLAATHTSPQTGHDWASLPPIEGVVGQIQRTIDPESFQRDLAVQQPPHPFLGALGHAVAAEAPAGTVAGLITTAVHPASAASELTHRTNAKAPRNVQRLERRLRRAVGRHRTCIPIVAAVNWVMWRWVSLRRLNVLPPHSTT